jgi:hypothetical protein
LDKVNGRKPGVAIIFPRVGGEMYCDCQSVPPHAYVSLGGYIVFLAIFWSDGFPST